MTTWTQLETGGSTSWAKNRGFVKDYEIALLTQPLDQAIASYTSNFGVAIADMTSLAANWTQIEDGVSTTWTQIANSS